jgi:hypothetical protein
LISTLLAQYGIWLILLGVGLIAVSIWRSMLAARRSQQAAYYVLREEANARMWRWVITGAATFVLTIVIAVSSAQAPQQVAIANVTPTAAPINSPASANPSPTHTAAPTLTPSPTDKPTATPSPSATPTIKPGSIPDELLTPIPSAVPPSASAKLSFTTLASILDSNKNPVDPGLAFPVGTRSVQVFFKASGVNNGATWGIFCSKNGRIVDSVVDLWQWGAQPQSSRAFCSLDGSSGSYLVDAYLGSAKQFEITFSLIVPPPTSTATPASTTTP